MMYASKHGHIVNIRRAPYAIGRIQMKTVQNIEDCKEESNYQEARRRNAESWNLYSIAQKWKGNYACFQMWPYKYENQRACRFTDIVDIRDGAKPSMNGLNDTSKWECLDE